MNKKNNVININENKVNNLKSQVAKVNSEDKFIISYEEMTDFFEQIYYIGYNYLNTNSPAMKNALITLLTYTLRLLTKGEICGIKHNISTIYGDIYDE